MGFSDAVSILALVLAACSFSYTWYKDDRNRRAKIVFKLDVHRSYQTKVKPDGTYEIIAEDPPNTRLLVQNMSSRPTAILSISARNQKGSVLMDVNGANPGGQMPMRLPPWGVEIIETTWHAGEQTEDLFFCVTDLDGSEHQVRESTKNPRLEMGSDPFESRPQGELFQNVDGKRWRKVDDN